jgi:hypothetical protein
MNRCLKLATSNLLCPPVCIPPPVFCRTIATKKTTLFRIFLFCLHSFLIYRYYLFSSLSLYNISFVSIVKKTTRKRIAVTSSLNNISTDHLGNMMVGYGGGVTPPPPPIPFYSWLLDRFFYRRREHWAVFPTPRIFALWREYVHENYIVYVRYDKPILFLRWGGGGVPVRVKKEN